MGFAVDFSEPWLETGPYFPTPSAVPQFDKVSIGDLVVPVVNTSFEPYRRDAFRHRSIQAQREQIDLTNIPGQGTVNSEGLWRREAVDWHYGAGQPFQDRKGSSDERFAVSKGIDPWTPWQVSLLSDTMQVKTLAGNGQVLQVGMYVYVLDLTANTLSFSSDLNSWTTVTGLSGTLSMMCTDGYNLYLACGSAGVYQTGAGSSGAVSYASGSVTGIWWAGERLMAAYQNNVYNIVTSGSALPSPLWTHPSSNFVWTAMCAGSSQIYMTGYNAGQGLPLGSLVYRSTIEATGTALTVPVQALPLDGGEYATALYGYLNYVFVGTNLGARMCRTIAAYDPTGNEGDLEAGPVIPGRLSPPGPVNTPVQCMMGNDRFVYFGWGNYDNFSTGLGRMDLSTFIDTQAPAFTSDLMVSGSGSVTSMDWCTINNQPVFVVQGMGVYTASGVNVLSGYVTSGYLTYGIPDDKIVWAGDIGTLLPQQGTVSMALGADGNSPTLVGTQYDSDDGGGTNQSVFPISQVRGEYFTVQMTLTRDPATDVSPIMHRWTLKALPAITAGKTISVVLSVKRMLDNAGQDTFMDPYATYAYLENLRTTQTVVTYTEGPFSELVVVDEIDWLPFNARDEDPEGGFEGDLICYLKSFDLGG